MQAYSQDHFTLYNIGKVFAIFFTLHLLNAFNSLPIIYQSLWTSSPIFNQLSSYWVSIVIVSFVQSTTQSLYSNYMLSEQKYTLNYTHAIYSWSSGLLLSLVFCIPIAGTYFITPTFYLQPDITQISTYIPTLGTLITTFLTITFTVCYIIGICLWMQKQKSTFAGASALVMITCYNMSQLSFVSIESYLLYAVLFIAISIFTYFMVIREDLTSIVGLVAGQHILSSILQTSFNPHPNCWLHTALLTSLCLIISYAITYTIQVHQKDPEVIS